MADKKKILVVDDEPSLVYLCTLILEDAGYAVRGANGGREALDLVDAEMPDFVLLDVMMPGVDGLDVCRYIRTISQDDERPYVMMYSADDRDTTRASSKEAGANSFITKDTPIHELAARINAIMTQIA